MLTRIQLNQKSHQQDRLIDNELRFFFGRLYRRLIIRVFCERVLVFFLFVEYVEYV